MELAERFKEIIRAGKRPPKILERKNFFMVFYAPSTRTRGAFEAGMELLCGHAPHIDVTTTRIGAGEGKKNWNTDGTHQLSIGYYIRGKVEEII